MAIPEEIQRELLEEPEDAQINRVNYDQKLAENSAEKQDAMSSLDKAYGDAIGNVDTIYQQQADAIGKWNPETGRFEGGTAGILQQNQQAETDFAIQQIEQQKAQSEKDYKKEQSAAYVDWQKQSNQYGVEAEKMASSGMISTGYSESSQVSMYNAYQNRVAVARESFGQAVVNYNNAITSARVQNNSALAEIALDALAQQSELIIQGFGYKNDLILQQANQKINLQNTYWQREFDILKQRDANIQAEVNRQWQAKESKLQREWQEKQDALERQHDKDMLKAKTEAEKEVADYNYAIEKKRLEDEYKAKLEYEKALADYELQKKLDMITKDTDEVGAGGSGSGSKLGGQSYKETSDALVRALGYDARANNHVNQAKTPFSGTTYDSAVSYLKSQGKTVGSLMTASEWSRRRNSYSMTGQGAAEVTKFSSYADYIQAFVQARMDGYGG